MEITRLAPSQLKKAAQAVAASFYDYPVFTFYFPDPKRRTRYLPWYMKNVLTCSLRYGEVYANAEVTGAIFTLPSEHARISEWEYIQNGFTLLPLVMGIHNYQRSMECEEFVGKTHEDLMQGRPHTYIWGLAVEPGHKAQGIGTALLQPVLAKAGEQNRPVYLETHNEKNVLYYQNHGFKLIHTACIPKFNMPFWCLLWEPA